MTQTPQVKIFFGVIALLLVGIIAAVFLRSSGEPKGPGQYDALAQCLKDKGAVFYGAFWCSHCQAQKKLFGPSQKLLSYVECSTPDGRAQTKVCIDKDITTYPTWEFADGSRLTGNLPLKQLAEKTGCLLRPSESGASESSL